MTAEQNYSTILMPVRTHIVFVFTEAEREITNTIEIDHQKGETYKTAEKEMKRRFPNKNFQFKKMYESLENFKK